MRFDERIRTANDNSPDSRAALGHGLVRRRFATSGRRYPYQNLSSSEPYFSSSKRNNANRTFGHAKSGSRENTIRQETFKAKFETITFSGLIVSLFAFVTALFAFPIFIYVSAVSILLFSGLILTRTKQPWRLQEMISLLPWLVITLVASLALNSLSAAAIVAGGTGLALSYFSKTRSPAIMGSLSLLALAGMYSSFVINSDSLNSTEGAILTTVLFGYVGLSGRLSSRGVLILSIMGLTVWGTIWVSGTPLPF